MVGVFEPSSGSQNHQRNNDDDQVRWWDKFNPITIRKPAQGLSSSHNRFDSQFNLVLFKVTNHRRQTRSVSHFAHKLLEGEQKVKNRGVVRYAFVGYSRTK